MAISNGEGKIEIPWSELIEMAEDFDGLLPRSSIIVWGKPRINLDNETVEIDYAYDSDENPANWIVKPKCLQN